MSENKSSPNKISNREKLAIFASEGGQAFYKMIKGNKEFYFESIELPKHEPEFDEMGENGWILVEREEPLPPYWHSRLRVLAEAGLVESGWGYEKEVEK